MANDGENANGQQFFITLDRASVLDGYHTVIGELVEGENTLKAIEENLTRHWTFTNEIKVEACGTR